MVGEGRGAWRYCGGSQPWNCLFTWGRGSKKDAAALRWYTKAAEQGFAEGQRNLAFLYHSGQGVPKDDAIAVRWYTKAADQGNVEAQSDLAAIYHLGGQGVPQDEAAQPCAGGRRPPSKETYRP